MHVLTHNIMFMYKRYTYIHLLCIHSLSIYIFYLQHGRVPLHYAADGGHVDTIRALVTDFQCPPDCKDNVSGIYSSSDDITINIIITQWNLSGVVGVLGSQPPWFK